MQTFIGSWYKLFFFLIFIYLWLCWVFVSVRGPSPAAASGGLSSSRCAGLPPSWPLPLRSTGSRCAGSAIVAHGPSRSAACGIPPDQGSNPSRTGRQTLNHCATREAPKLSFYNNNSYHLLSSFFLWGPLFSDFIHLFYPHPNPQGRYFKLPFCRRENWGQWD